MGKRDSSKEIKAETISKNLHDLFYSKYLLIICISIEIITVIATFYKLITASLELEDAVKFMGVFILLVGGLILSFVKTQKSSHFLALMSGIENLGYYIESIKNIKYPKEYNEAIYWFSEYIRITFIKESGSSKLSLLHQLTKKKNGICPAAGHMLKFQKLCGILQTEQYDMAPQDFENEIKELKKAILSDDDENLVIVRKPKDSNIAIYALIGLIQILGAFISGIEGKITLNPFSIGDYNWSVTISNMCFYGPLVVLNILLYKGVVKDRKEKAEIENK